VAGDRCRRARRLDERGSVTFLAPVDGERARLWYVLLDLPRSVDAFLALHGTPIRYRYVAEALPLAAYQTVFARVPGSAEMPSAGRPFPPGYCATCAPPVSTSPQSLCIPASRASSARTPVS